MAPSFTPAEVAYLRSQRLGRLATVDSSGTPQNSPVGFVVDDATSQILVGGRDLGRTRKFRNVQRNPHAAFVVDDIVSTDPWTVRFVEIRGSADALVDVDPPIRGLSRELIRITPRWIGSYGVDPEELDLVVRT